MCVGIHFSGLQANVWECFWNELEPMYVGMLLAGDWADVCVGTLFAGALVNVFGNGFGITEIQ